MHLTRQSTYVLLTQTSMISSIDELIEILIRELQIEVIPEKLELLGWGNVNVTQMLVHIWNRWNLTVFHNVHYIEDVT